MTAMTKSENLISDILQAADGKIVGRIRLQKIFYLLDQFGLNSGFRFSYHHYGPYSEDLSASVMRARFLDKLIDEKEERTSYDTPFSVYTLREAKSAPDKIGALDFETAHRLIDIMKAETSVVLELAATIHWLREKEKVDDWRAELGIRKPSKATPEFIQRAGQLLSKLQSVAS
jgi:uncharacterized protein YwgA